MVTSGNLPKGVRLPEQLQGHFRDFDPLKADERTLKHYGLPPRPDEKRQPQQFEIWKGVVSHLRGSVPASFELLDDSKKATSGRWAGAATTDVGKDESFVGVIGQCIAPCPYPPQAQQGTYDCNSWIGLDGYGGSTDILRAGTTQRVIAGADGEVTKRRVFAWYQWYPEQKYTTTTFPVQFGDTIFCAIYVYEKTEALVFFYNRGSQVFTSFFVEPGDAVFVGTSAEWIVENPSVTEPQTPLASFGSTFFKYCFAGTNKWNPKDLSNATLIDMTSSDGSSIATATKENSSLLGVRE